MEVNVDHEGKDEVDELLEGGAETEREEVNASS
jgi:hypothetical protein